MSVVDRLKGVTPKKRSGKSEAYFKVKVSCDKDWEELSNPIHSNILGYSGT